MDFDKLEMMKNASRQDQIIITGIIMHRSRRWL